MQHLVDRQFLIWEKQNQPRRAMARLSACSSHTACFLQPNVAGSAATEQTTDNDFDVVGTLI